MIKLKEVIHILERFAPVALQEPYDNSGLILGEPDQEVGKGLIALDVTEEVRGRGYKEKMRCGFFASSDPV
jgi:putative NIF3 family GTP cyclohydrolase 1 type 2